MGTNKYINLFHQKQEQNLVQTLIQEAIRFYGIDAIYILKKQDNVDPIYTQDVLSYFDDYYDIEVYVKNIDAFEGESDIFRKFGLEIKNQITFTIARSRFAEVVGKELIRPREGDLIYLPMSTARALYEIRFVKDDSIFYNLGEFYVYDLQCEQLALQDENIKTGIDEIDELSDDTSQTQRLYLGNGSGTYEYGEFVYQGTSLIGAEAKGTVVEFNNPIGTLLIKDIFGEFKIINGNIIGERSGATYQLAQDLDTQNIQQDYSAENKQIEEVANAIINFSEDNPFSEDDY